MATSLNELAQEIYKTAQSKGWYTDERTLPELLVLVHSELSEALESWRDNEHTHWHKEDEHGNFKPEGWGVELADAIIRVLDMCAYFNIDIDRLVREKIDYNKTRSYRHGGKRC